MGKITPEMTREEIGSNVEIQDKTEYIVSLYKKYAKDLLRVRKTQKLLSPTMIGWCMFDDIDAEIMYLSIRDLKPKVLVEISCGNGWSTSWILNAIKDNGFGFLNSYDIHDASTKNLPDNLTNNIWKFTLGDIHEKTKDVPSKIDFLLMDSEHSDEFCYWFVDEFFPRVKSGGKILVHDIFMLRTPAHGDAIAVFKYFDKINALPYTCANVFPEYCDRIIKVRREIGIKDDDLISNNQKINCLLLYDVE